ncbi:MAG TPA: NADH-quinone oxidoreductase subunit C [Verrucomicrobiales bacterium]|nr:NADH-quinone oxidoreductase subunit C [Verrucomicrobiales bacterium]
MTTAAEFAKQLKTEFGELISEPTEFRGEITVNIANASRITEVCEFAKHELGFDYLIDISTLDNYGEDPRFSVVYELSSILHRQHLRLKTQVTEEHGEVPTVTGVWRTADWHEREAYDMMGIKFTGHPNLTRILMWEGYPHFPLRKDFPLEGKPTEVPDVAFTQTAPMEGGPFVTVASSEDTTRREPRRRNPEDGK